MKNVRHSRRGNVQRVEPIRKLKDIRLIKLHLSERPRDLALFTVGINTYLRAGDLLNLRLEQVQNLSPNSSFAIKERKTGKARLVMLNGAALRALRPWLAIRGGMSGESVFVGQRGPLTVPTLSRMVKQWCREINLRGNYASHTLRKTWGYHQHITFGVDLHRLMACFNHRSQKQTLDYLCIPPEGIEQIFDQLFENEL